MSNEWIKIDAETPDKSEVWEIADILGIETDSVMGKLVRVWAWASRNCDDAGVTIVTVKYAIDRITAQNGFANAMEKVKWLQVKNKKLIFPNFEYHMSKSAKDKALARQRSSKYRKRIGDGFVMEKSRSGRDENIPPIYTNNSKAPTLDEVKAYCAKRGNIVDPEQFFENYQATGWIKKNGEPVKSWKSTVITWEKNEKKFNSNNTLDNVPLITDDLVAAEVARREGRLL